MNLLNFDTLPRSLQQAIFTRELVTGQRLFWQGDPATALFIVKTGRLRLVRYTIDGREVPLQFVSSGDSLGDAALVCATYSYTAIAEVASKVVVYPKQQLTAAVRENSDLAEDAIATSIKYQIRLDRELKIPFKRCKNSNFMSGLI